METTNLAKATIERLIESHSDGKLTDKSCKLVYDLFSAYVQVHGWTYDEVREYGSNIRNAFVTEVAYVEWSPMAAAYLQWLRRYEPYERKADRIRKVMANQAKA